MRKFFLQTFGCRCNQADSAAIREGLCRNALRESGSPVDADLVVVNTCTVTHRTDQQVRQALRKMHRENPDARIVVTGCYAARDPWTIAALPGVQLVLGNAEKDRLAETVLEEANGSCAKIISAALDAGRNYLLAPMSETGGKTRPLVKLQDGCDARCSYCIVPWVRGPGRSARPEDILAEIRALIDKGYQEVVLTGVHLGAYGGKLENPTELLDLLRKILALTGLGRLRLGSIEPMRFDRGMARLAAENPAFAPHFHIPVQSGSDRILRHMRRPYTAALFQDLLQDIHTLLPTAGLGTDVLVGFPGETEEDFEQTCDVIRRSPLTYLHVFPFSAREGTAAYSMPGRVSPAVVRERARILREFSHARNLAFRKRFAGKVLKGITLAKEEEMGEAAVLTENYIQARLTGQDLVPNRLVNVRLDQVLPHATYASLV